MRYFFRARLPNTRREVFGTAIYFAPNRILNVFFGCSMHMRCDEYVVATSSRGCFLNGNKSSAGAPRPLTPPPQCVGCKLFYGAFYFVFLPAIDVDFEPLGLAGDELLFS
jgi:hypothetical protein